MAKRAISLIITFILCITQIGTAVSGSISNFDDNISTETIESLQMLSSLGIMKGYEDGNIDPNGYLTRAQAAKLIYVARTGYDDNADSYKKIGFSLFTDVPDDFWGAGYINYLVLKGYASGKGNGKFDPNGLITGIEYMKILLAALGYDSVIEGFINNIYWKFNVIDVAVSAGLTTGYYGNPDAYVLRGDAAILTKNMIDSRTITYDRNKNHIFSESTFGKQFFDLEKNIGVVTANEDTDINLRGKTTIEVPEGGIGKTGTYSVSTKFEDIGKAVIIYTNGNSLTNIYGAANVRPINKTVTTYTALNDKSERDNGSLRYWLSENGLKIDTAAPVCVTKSLGVPLFDQFNSNSAGEKLTAIDNDRDGKVDYMIKIIEVAAFVTVKRTTGVGNIQFDSIPGNWNSKNVTSFSSLSVGDVVLAYEVGGKLNVRKAESFDGEMTSCIPAYGKATINGILYGASSLALDDIDGSNSDSVTFADWIADGDNFYKKRTFYLDGGGNIVFISIPKEQSISQYAYILETAASVGSWPDYEPIAYVRLLFEDGTIGVRRVGSLNSKLIKSMSESELNNYFDAHTPNENLLVGKIASFTSWESESDIGSEDSFVALSTEKVSLTNLSGNIDFGNPNLVEGSIYADNRTVYVSYDQEKNTAKTYIGVGEMSEYEVSSGAVVHENNIAKVVFLISAKQIFSTSQIVFVTDGPTMTVSPKGEVIYTYPVFMDGKEGTLSVSESNSDLSVGLYRYTVSEWGEYTFEPYDDVIGTASIVGDGIVVVNSTAYMTDKDTDIFIVGSDFSVSTGKISDLAFGDSVIIVSSSEPNQYHADQIYIQAP